MTIGEAYGPAMKITDQTEAEKYFIYLVRYLMGHDSSLTRDKAETLVRANLGYYAGYYDHETRARVEQLFGCAHPIFGAIATNGSPTPAQALQAGIDLVFTPTKGARHECPERWEPVPIY